MPVCRSTFTSEIVQCLPHLVDKYNRCERKYVNSYNRFMQIRIEFLAKHGRNFVRLLRDHEFINHLRDILVDFGLDIRGSRLARVEQILDTASRVGPEIDLLYSEGIFLHTLNLHQRMVGQTVDSTIRNLFDHFAEPGLITEAGGFVAASKTMHFIMPEVFIMLDGQHIAISLYNVQDYNPHPEDGRYWSEVVPDYSGKKPNPSPRGEGRVNWDAERYVIALLYYKRIIREWCLQNEAHIKGFLQIDAQNASQPSRIIDKALW